MTRIIGIDYGTSRTGIAISDLTGCIAQPVCTIFEKSADALIDKIYNMAVEHNACEFVIGLPRNMDGSIGERARSTLCFMERLQTRCRLPVYSYDERLTTASAHNALGKLHISGKKRVGKVDTIAATIILQAYLDRKNFVSN